MPGNSFGKIFRLTSFGESHGKAIGGIIEGCPPGIKFDYEFIQSELNRRRPGQSSITSQRTEADEVDFLSGIFEGKSTGTAIAFVIRNHDHISNDYDQLKDVYRPSHADFSYEKKYGIRDHRGGGRASARETIARVVAGSIAKMVLKKLNIKVYAWVSSIGDISLETSYEQLDLLNIDSNIVYCPDIHIAENMINRIKEVKDQGDSIGGIISSVIKNVPPGLGDPVFDKISAELGKAILSINAVKAFELGSGFKGSKMKGSEHNDSFINKNNRVGTKTNFSGGIQGGITNGEDIFFRLAIKPTSTIYLEQETINKELNKTIIKVEGRHDPCIVPRAVPIVESMAAIVILDHLLLNKTVHI